MLATSPESYVRSSVVTALFIGVPPADSGARGMEFGVGTAEVFFSLFVFCLPL